MTKIVDVVDVSKNGDVDGLIKDLSEATAQNASATVKEPAKPERPDYIEEKYWTGDVESSLQKQHEAFRSMQTRLGQMRNEVGTTRQLADELIGIKRQLDLQGQKPPEPKPLPKVTASALLENPEQSLQALLDAREERLREQYEARIAGLESQLTGVTLQQQHGDYQTLVQDPDWHEWLNSDPVRQREAQYAAQGDTVLGSKLISEFKAQRTSQKPTEQEPKAPSARGNGDNVSAAAAAALETAAAGEASTGKIYSRTALMLLKQRNPEVYEDPRFQDEILKAYQEKRVR